MCGCVWLGEWQRVLEAVNQEEGLGLLGAAEGRAQPRSSSACEQLCPRGLWLLTALSTCPPAKPPGRQGPRWPLRPGHWWLSVSTLERWKRTVRGGRGPQAQPFPLGHLAVLGEMRSWEPAIRAPGLHPPNVGRGTLSLPVPAFHHEAVRLRMVRRLAKATQRASSRARTWGLSGCRSAASSTGCPGSRRWFSGGLVCSWGCGGRSGVQQTHCALSSAFPGPTRGLPCVTTSWLP